MSNPYPWYDSNWLYAYVQAKNIIGEKHPGELKDFIAAFEPLRTRADFSTKSLGNVISDNQRAQIMGIISSITAAEIERHELFNFGRMIVHNNDYLTGLQEELTDRVSEAVREPVEPCYNFLSLYNNLGVCDVHMDAPEAKWTLDICIDQSDDWPIYFSQVKDWPEDFAGHQNNWQQGIKEDPENTFTAYEIKPKEGIIFSGSSQWHYRERIPKSTRENYCHLVFLHYVPEGMGSLVNPKQWPAYFNVPELDKIVNAYRSNEQAYLNT